MTHFGRDYREIMTGDIESAISGLKMWSRTTAWLRGEIEAHQKIDAFASAVIVAAARQIIGERAID